MPLALQINWLKLFPDRPVRIKFPKDYKVMENEQAVEQELQAKGLNAPRLTPTLISEQINHEQYYNFPGTTLIVCCLTLKNGYHVIGESAAASPENFDAIIGKRIAKDKARDRIWALEGYLLRSKLSGHVK